MATDPSILARKILWTEDPGGLQSMGLQRVRYNWATEDKGWRRLLTVPWTTRGSNQSILKEINPEYSLEGLMLKLKLQYFGHLMGRADSLENTLVLGKSEGGRRRGRQRRSWLEAGLTHWTWAGASSRRCWRSWVGASSRRRWRTGNGAAAVRAVAKSRAGLTEWTALLKSWLKWTNGTPLARRFIIIFSFHWTLVGFQFFSSVSNIEKKPVHKSDCASDHFFMLRL